MDIFMAWFHHNVSTNDNEKSKVIEYHDLPHSFLSGDIMTPDLFKFLLSCNQEFQNHGVVGNTQLLSKLTVGKEIILNQRRALGILACALVSRLPSQEVGFDGQSLNFSGFHSDLNTEKAKCLINYFETCKQRVCDSSGLWQGTNLGFYRVVLSPEIMPSRSSWMASIHPLTSLTVLAEGSIEIMTGHLHADFANR
jgi:Poly (ADP-ribose) glycohydrolase (PARG)